MAVTQSSDGNTKQSGEEGAELSCRKGAVADAYGPIPLRTSNGPSNGKRERNKDSSRIVKSYKLRKNQTKDKSDNLSDIDDVEVSGYLNSKEEIHYKTILWEIINRNSKKAKKQKIATETKKVVSAEKTAKKSENVELQKRSTRINYDALKLLDSDSAEGSETAQMITKQRCDDSPQGNISEGMYESEESSYNEDGHGISSFQDKDDFGYHASEIGDMYTDEHMDDEYFDF